MKSYGLYGFRVDRVSKRAGGLQPLDFVGAAGMDQVFVVLGAESEGQQTLDGPLTTGLARVSRTVPGLVPWAWAINGCASVVSAVLATLLAIHIGFSGVVLAAVALYGLAAVAAPMINAENAAFQ